LVIVLSAGCLTLAGCGQAGSGGTASGNARHDHEHGELDHGHEHTIDLERAFAEASTLDSGNQGDNGADAETFAEAIKKIGTLRTQVKESLAAGDMAGADGPVHEIGHLLEQTVELARKEISSNADLQEVQKAVDQLLDAFGELDATLHGRPGKTYDQVESKIESALGDLESRVQP
jgi:hypothetical protein